MAGADGIWRPPSSLFFEPQSDDKKADKTLKKSRRDDSSEDSRGSSETSDSRSYSSRSSRRSTSSSERSESSDDESSSSSSEEDQLQKIDQLRKSLHQEKSLIQKERQRGADTESERSSSAPSSSSSANSNDSAKSAGTESGSSSSSATSDRKSEVASPKKVFKSLKELRETSASDANESQTSEAKTEESTEGKSTEQPVDAQSQASSSRNLNRSSHHTIPRSTGHSVARSDGGSSTKENTTRSATSTPKWKAKAAGKPAASWMKAKEDEKSIASSTPSFASSRKSSKVSMPSWVKSDSAKPVQANQRDDSTSRQQDPGGGASQASRGSSTTAEASSKKSDTRPKWQRALSGRPTPSWLNKSQHKEDEVELKSPPSEDNQKAEELTTAAESVASSVSRDVSAQSEAQGSINYAALFPPVQNETHTEEEELEQLLQDIQRVGVDGEPNVTFGELFEDPEVEQYYEALVGTLKMAKKAGLVEFEGEMLLKGPHDDVVISISNKLMGLKDGTSSELKAGDSGRMLVSATAEGSSAEKHASDEQRSSKLHTASVSPATGPTPSPEPTKASAESQTAKSLNGLKSNDSQEEKPNHSRSRGGLVLPVVITETSTSDKSSVPLQDVDVASSKESNSYISGLTRENEKPLPPARKIDKDVPSEEQAPLANEGFHHSVSSASSHSNSWLAPSKKTVEKRSQKAAADEAKYQNAGVWWKSLGQPVSESKDDWKSYNMSSKSEKSQGLWDTVRKEFVPSAATEPDMAQRARAQRNWQTVRATQFHEPDDDHEDTEYRPSKSSWVPLVETLKHKHAEEEKLEYSRLGTSTPNTEETLRPSKQSLNAIYAARAAKKENQQLSSSESDDEGWVPQVSKARFARVDFAGSLHHAKKEEPDDDEPWLPPSLARTDSDSSEEIQDQSRGAKIGRVSSRSYSSSSEYDVEEVTDESDEVSEYETSSGSDYTESSTIEPLNSFDRKHSKAGSQGSGGLPESSSHSIVRFSQHNEVVYSSDDDDELIVHSVLQSPPAPIEPYTRKSKYDDYDEFDYDDDYDIEKGNKTPWITCPEKSWATMTPLAIISVTLVAAAVVIPLGWLAFGWF